MRFDFAGKRGAEIFNKASSYGRKGLAGISKARGVITKAQNFAESDQGKALHTLLAASDVLSGNRANLTGKVDKVYRGVNTAGRFADDIENAVNTAKSDIRGMQGGNPMAALAGLTAVAGLITTIMRSRQMRGGAATDFSKIANDALRMAKQQGIKGLPDKLSKSDIKKVYDISKNMVQNNGAVKAASGFGAQVLQNTGKIQDFADSIGLGKQVAPVLGFAESEARKMAGGMSVRQLYQDVSKILGPRMDIRNIYDDVQAKARHLGVSPAVVNAGGRAAMNFADQNRWLADDFSKKLGLSNQTNMAYNFGRSMTGSGSLPRLPGHDGLSYMRSVHSLYA